MPTNIWSDVRRIIAGTFCARLPVRSLETFEDIKEALEDPTWRVNKSHLELQDAIYHSGTHLSTWSKVAYCLLGVVALWNQSLSLGGVGLCFFFIHWWAQREQVKEKRLYNLIQPLDPPAQAHIKRLMCLHKDNPLVPHLWQALEDNLHTQEFWSHVTTVLENEATVGLEIEKDLVDLQLHSVRVKEYVL